MTQPTPTPPDLPTHLTVSEAADLFGRHRRWIIFLIRSGQLPATFHPNIGARGIYKIDAHDLLNTLRLRQRGGGHRPLDPSDLN